MVIDGGWSEWKDSHQSDWPAVLSRVPAGSGPFHGNRQLVVAMKR